ncbi:MAG: hypothetical protein V4712_07735 [Pseudomonadota bacterium]
MVENVNNLVLEQLRLIREDIGTLRSDLAQFKTEVRGDLSEVHSDLLAQKTMIFGLAGVIGQIDQRVEHLETKLGA